MYTYRGRIIDVHDGDTVTVVIDLGFDITTTRKLRLHGINTPELPTPEGKRALYFVLDWLKRNAPGPAAPGVIVPSGWVVIQTIKDRTEKYGRYLAEVEAIPVAGVPNGPSLNNELLASGNAVAYMTNR